ncbi:MAG: phospholipase [Catenulispora sp.]|nr:phospholipase [Catenulispora sp.]
MTAEAWFLSRTERGNPASTIESFTTGNAVRALVHGRTYFRALHRAIADPRAGDTILFTDWRADLDELLDGPGTAFGEVLTAAAGRGVVIQGLIWRSHAERHTFSAEPNRALVDAIQAAGGDCLLDMRVKVGGSHHQKLFVVRHPDRPEADVAFVGGIDICHSRGDSADHDGDAQTLPMNPAYGERPPWHDVQLEIRGPAVSDVETVFRERWNDPAELTRHPLRRLRDTLDRRRNTPATTARHTPPPPPAGDLPVQVLRTYPRLRYPFAPRGERSIARAYLKALPRARRLIYIEDQYLWSTEVARPFAEALRRNPELHLIAVLPKHPDSAHGLVAEAELYGRRRAMALLRKAGGDRVACYTLENPARTPIYVHAKVCVIDDTWSTVGSDNFNLRSWTYDSELSCAVFEPDGFPRDLRLTLQREHLGRVDGDDGDLLDPMSSFAAFAKSAAELDSWHDAGCTGARPAGQLRRYDAPALTSWRKPAAKLIQQVVCDPDGRPKHLRLRHHF